MSGLLERATPIHDHFFEIESIPLSERDQVYAEIDRAIDRGKLKITSETFRFSPRKKGRTFPILINLVSLAVLLIVGASLIIYFSISEQEIISNSSSVNLTESRIITALREESEKELTEKESEISRIQTEMDSLLDQKEILLMEAESERIRLEEALARRLEDQLSREEDRLLALNMNQEAIDEQLDSLRSSLQDQYEEELKASLAAEEEKRLRREQELEEEIARMEESLESAQREKETLTADLTEQQRTRSTTEQAFETLTKKLENEQFLDSQINASFDGITQSLQSGNYPRALEEIDTFKTFLSNGNFAEYPALMSRAGTDRRILDTLDTMILLSQPLDGETGPPPVFAEITALIEEGQQHFDSSRFPEAKEAILKALALIPDLQSGYQVLQSMEESERNELMLRFEQEFQKGQRAFLSKNDLTARQDYYNALTLTGLNSNSILEIMNNLRSMGARSAIAEVQSNLISDEDLAFLEYARVDYKTRLELMETIRNLDTVMDEIQEGLPYADNEEDLLKLLQKKVLLKEILVSDTVSRESPDVYNSLEEYMDSYGIIQASIGKTLALRETASMLDALLKESIYLPSPDDPEQKDLYQEILSDLTRMVEPISREE